MEVTKRGMDMEVNKRGVGSTALPPPQPLLIVNLTSKMDSTDQKNPSLIYQPFF